MTVSQRSVADAAFGALVDYAGLFPPAALSMHAAAEAYAAARAGAHAWMLGRFIVPASRLDELAAVEPAPSPERSVILDADRDPRAWFDAIGATIAGVAARRDRPIGAFEVALPALLSRRDSYDAAVGQLRALLDRAALGALPVYLEAPRTPAWQDRLESYMQVLRRYGFGAKVRCGGLDAAAFPSVDELAAFVTAAATEGVRYKATAGLHHPVRHHDATLDLPMHGFLNILIAALLAATGDAGDVRAVLAEDDARAFVFAATELRWRGHRFSAADVARVRRDAFVAYGSCSFAEPVDDLVALGAIAP